MITPTASAPTPAETDPVDGRVLAVVVAHQPGDWFDTTLQSLADQTFEKLDTVVVNTEPGPGDALAKRVAAILPAARIETIVADTFPAGANAVLDLDHGATHFLIMHDDVALAPDAVRRLMNESAASDASVVGPKLVEWEHPDVLLEVGLGSDKFAQPVSAIEGRELDQEQHDAVADVFAVPSACFLIRTGLFEDLGGFDPGIPSNGDDVDLGWRAVVAGARIIVAPDAVVRHRADGGSRWGDATDERLRLRHQVRTVLGGYGSLRLARVIPQMWLLWLVEMVAAVFTLRLGRVRDLAGAWTWNYRRLGQASRKRADLEAVRAIDDGELRDYQERGSARVGQFFSTHFVNDEGESSIAAVRQSISTSLSIGATRNALVAMGVLSVVLAFGSRQLLGGLPEFGEFAALTDPGASWGEWWSGWWQAGLGTNAPVPTAYGFFGGLGTVLFGATGFLRTVLVLGMIPVGLVGMWRLLGVTRSRAAQALAVLVYAFVPVPYNALADGSWATLALYAVLPWVLNFAWRASAAAPAPRSTRPATLLWACGRIALVLAIGAMFTPLVVPAALLLLFGLVLGSLVSGSLRGVARIATVMIIGAVGGVVLHLPGAISFLHNGVQWAPLGGAGRTGPGELSLLDLLRFDTGPFTSTWLPFALLAPAVFALLLGRGWRLVWAVRGWFVAIVGWGVAWAHQWGISELALPASEVPLAVAAVGLSLAAAMAVPAFEHDLGRHRFGWRQIGAGVAVLGVALGGVPLIAAAIDGGWNAPDRGFATEYAELFADDDMDYRVLWLGEAELLPMASWAIDSHASFALTENGGPTSRDQTLAPLDNDTRRVLTAVQQAGEGRSGRLGEALAPMAVRYVVLLEANAPAPFATRSSADTAATGQLRSGLAQQLDLVRVEGINGSFRLYRNDAFFAARATVPPGSNDIPDPADTEPVLPDTLDANRFSGPFTPGADLHMATAADQRWRLTVDGQTSVRSVGFGWANRFTPTVQGNAELFYRTPPTRRVALIAQLVAWAFAISVFWLRRVPRPMVTAKRATMARQTSDSAPTTPSKRQAKKAESARDKAAKAAANERDKVAKAAKKAEKKSGPSRKSGKNQREPHTIDLTSDAVDRPSGRTRRKRARK